MSKKTSSSIYLFEYYIQTPKLNPVLKICFNNDELHPWDEKIKTLQVIEMKWGNRIYCQPRIFTVFLQRR